MTERRIRRDPYADPRGGDLETDDYVDYDDDPGYEPEERRRGISPVAIFLVIAIVGSIAYMAYVVTVREATQIPLARVGRGGPRHRVRGACRVLSAHGLARRPGARQRRTHDPDRPRRRWRGDGRVGLRGRRDHPLPVGRPSGLSGTLC